MDNSDRQKARVMFGPYPQKRELVEQVQKQVGPVGSEQFRRIWSIWEEIDAERHQNPPCDDPYCDRCGREFMGDDW